MRARPADLPRPDPDLHETGTELDGDRGGHELRLLEHFGMQPSSDVLDIGCGIGRFAYECSVYLDDDATYTGIDIAPVAIDWLNQHYAPVLPGFRFDLHDVRGTKYRPEGKVGPEHARLPYPDDRFDVVCAFEVFMHLPLEGVRNYLREIERVLRPGGLAVVTLVIFYPGEEAVDHGDGRPYVQVADGVHTRFPNRSATSMAFDLDLVRSLLQPGLAEIGLVEGRIHVPMDRRPGLEEIRRERRRRLVGARLAEEGVDEAAVARAIEADARPAPIAEDPPPLYHPCDVLALRKGAAPS